MPKTNSPVKKKELSLLGNLIPLWVYTGGEMQRPELHYDYVLARQGIVKRFENSFVSVDYLLAPVSENLIGLQLEWYPLRPLHFKLPKIPVSLLQDVLNDARQDMSLEFAYHFRYNSDPGEWVVTRPENYYEQSRTGLGYYYKPDGLVLELHSHNTMPAYFSPRDNLDEQGGRLYGVIGHIERRNPELALRLGMFGHWLYDVPGQAIFDDVSPFIEVELGGGAEVDDRWLFEDSAGDDSPNWLANLFSRKNWR
jgi:PRTRC genetic system protein A